MTSLDQDQLAYLQVPCAHGFNHADERQDVLHLIWSDWLQVASLEAGGRNPAILLTNPPRLAGHQEKT